MTSWLADELILIGLLSVIIIEFIGLVIKVILIILNIEII